MKNQLILVVDDNAGMRKAVEDVLKHYGYHNILQAENGQAAMEIIEARHPALVITDLRMPGMRGEELIRWICRDYRPRHSEIKTVAMTAGDPGIFGPMVESAGGDGFFQKINMLQDLEANLNRLLD